MFVNMFSSANARHDAIRCDHAELANVTECHRMSPNVTECHRMPPNAIEIGKHADSSQKAPKSFWHMLQYVKKYADFESEVRLA